MKIKKDQFSKKLSFFKNIYLEGGFFKEIAMFGSYKYTSGKKVENYKLKENRNEINHV